MKKTKSKRRVTLALALCLLVSCLLPVGASAATAAGFSDISDTETAVSVEVLRLMGAAGGYSDGTFRPGEALTRGQFCKMVVMTQNKGGQAMLYKYHTIFRDVKPSHSAAGYINLAVKGSSKPGGEDGKDTVVTGGIISGDASGYFHPDKPITYAQAVTSLMRMLGYQDTDVGAVWPDGYLLMAAECGLTEGLTMAPSANLTRGMAAKLFARLLATNMKGGGTSFGASIATPVADVVLLSSNATAADGSASALKTTDGKTYKLANGTSSGLLNGRKGTLLLDKNNNVLTFVPTGMTNTKTVTIATVKADSFTDTQGGKYTVQSTVPVYYQGANKTYGDMIQLLAGQSVTLSFGSNGQVEYMFTGTAATSTDAVVVSAKGSTAGFAELAGGNTNYKIYKNGLLAGPSDLRQYDVAVYNGANNSIQVTDTRLTGMLEDIAPNLDAPSSVTMMGRKFNVLPGAAADFAGRKMGSSLTLLLTADYQVAGAVTPSGSVGNNAVGIVTKISASDVTVQLLNGLELTGGHVIGADYGNYLNQLVNVSSERTKVLALTKLATSGGGNVNLTEKKVGGAFIADNVRVYEKVGKGELTQITLGQLTQNIIPSGKVSYVGYDWAGRVNLLILNDVTGNSYKYGKLTITLGGESSNTSFLLDYGSGSVTLDGSFGPFGLKNGGYYGFAISADGKSIASHVELKELKGQSAASWKGDLVNVNGITYPISDAVVCYNRTTGQFISLTAARAWGAKANFYYDVTPDQGGKIRLIEVS